MRILMLTWNYPPLVGGSEQMAQRLVQKLVSKGHTVEVWTARRSDAPAFEQPTPRLTIRRRFYGIPWGPLFGISVFVQTAVDLWRVRGQFDIVHSHQTSWCALGSLRIRRAAGLPMVIRVASSGPANDVRLIRERKGGRWLIPLLGRADAVVALCRAARQEVLESGDIPPDRIVLVPNGVELESFETLPQEQPDPGFLLYVGRFHRLKGVDVLLRAFCEVLETHPRARLALVGDGPERTGLEVLATGVGLTLARSSTEEGAVQFAGMQSDPRPFYGKAAVVVLPSRTEGMSNVMIEAMAAGRPIVATAVGGNSDLLDPDDRRSAAPDVERQGVFLGANGVLVPPENPHALARGIRVLLEDSARAHELAKSARRFVELNCTLEAVADRYVRLYQRLTTERSRGTEPGALASGPRT